MVPFAGLLAALEGIPDPRRRQGRRYPLAPLLLFSVLAVLAGATSYRGILIFIGVHRERLNATFGTRLRRAPAVNTLRDLLHALDPAAIEAAFRRHAEHLGDASHRAGAAGHRARRQDAAGQLRPSRRPGRGAGAQRLRQRGARSSWPIRRSPRATRSRRPRR